MMRPNRGPVEDCRGAEAIDKAGFPDLSIRRVGTAGPEISRRSCSTIAGSKFMKFTDDPALKLVSGPIAQALMTVSVI
jgi:hypothetical protein